VGDSGVRPRRDSSLNPRHTRIKHTDTLTLPRYIGRTQNQQNSSTLTRTKGQGKTKDLRPVNTRTKLYFFVHTVKFYWQLWIPTYKTSPVRNRRSTPLEWLSSTRYLDLGSGHTAYVVRHLFGSIYISNFIEIRKNFIVDGLSAGTPPSSKSRVHKK